MEPDERNYSRQRVRVVKGPEDALVLLIAGCYFAIEFAVVFGQGPVPVPLILGFKIVGMLGVVGLIGLSVRKVLTRPNYDSFAYMGIGIMGFCLLLVADK